MRLKDHTMHFNYFRMQPSMFDELLSLVGPSIVRKGSNFREPLSPSLKLAVTLRYLATGELQASLSFNFRIGRSTVSEVLNEVPHQIWNAISPISMATHSECKRLADDFWNLWNFLLCLGAIDGKHYVIICPPKCGSAFYNYKGSFCIVFKAVADAYTIHFIEAFSLS